MVVYYINKNSENLADYPYPIKEGDICMLYDGEVVKTIYIDSEADVDSIWRDFKFVDTKSLKSYKFPTSNSILCAPIGKSQAKGDAVLLTRLIQECKGEWLLDFLNETSSVLSGFVGYWDLEILRRLTGDSEIKVDYADEEMISNCIGKDNEDEKEENDIYIVDVDDVEFLPKNSDTKWFCLSVLSCFEDKLKDREYQILYDTLNGVPRKKIASKWNLTQERVRQITVKATKQVKEQLVAQRSKFEEIKEENTKLRAQLNLLKEEIVSLKEMIPAGVIFQDSYSDIDTEIAELLDTPIKDMNLSVRAFNILKLMDVHKFIDIPQIESEIKLLNVKNSGRKTAHEISSFLYDFYLTFGMSVKEIISALKLNDWYTAKKKWLKEINKKNEYKEQKVLILEETFCKEIQKEIEKEKPTESGVVLTKDIIESARTPNGGFTQSQLEAIGVAWPPSQDWVEEVVGKMITPTQLEAFKNIEYVKKTTQSLFQKNSSKTYKDVANNPIEKMKMEAILHAMTHLAFPAAPRDIARIIDRREWGEGAILEDTVDSFLKRLPEVEYIKWGKYILKNSSELKIT